MHFRVGHGALDVQHGDLQIALAGAGRPAVARTGPRKPMPASSAAAGK